MKIKEIIKDIEQDIENGYFNSKFYESNISYENIEELIKYVDENEKTNNYLMPVIITNLNQMCFDAIKGGVESDFYSARNLLLDLIVELIHNKDI